MPPVSLCTFLVPKLLLSQSAGGLACYDTLGYEDHHVRLTTLELSFVLCHGTTSAFAPSRAHHACQVCTPNARVPSITSQRQWLLWLGLKSVVICLLIMYNVFFLVSSLLAWTSA